MIGVIADEQGKERVYFGERPALALRATAVRSVPHACGASGKGPWAVSPIFKDGFLDLSWGKSRDGRGSTAGDYPVRL